MSRAPSRRVRAAFFNMYSEIYISLGSNSGDRHAMIGRAVCGLAEAFAHMDATIKVAEPVAGPAVGFVSENPFVNVGVLLSVRKSNAWTAAELESLLDATQAVERSISSMPHRNADGSYRDREIDIDIIAVDDVVYSSERLVLPHPRMRGRYFVLRPMVSLLPGWRYPATRHAVEDMLSECGDTENHACAE